MGQRRYAGSQIYIQEKQTQHILHINLAILKRVSVAILLAKLRDILEGRKWHKLLSFN